MSYLIANWPAPSHIQALTTTRLQGVSASPYDNNLAFHVDDNHADVHTNRATLRQKLALPDEPLWLEQTHSNHCIVAGKHTDCKADAAVAYRSETTKPLAIMTADCLPITLCNQAGTEIAAIHAGWRGLVNGIIENTVQKMSSNPDSLLAWIGPAICGNCYEIGEEVKQAYVTRYPFTTIAFQQQGSSYYADLPKIASLVLNQCGILAVYHAQVCSFEESTRFYSYRREKQTGRMATLIWFKP